MQPAGGVIGGRNFDLTVEFGLWVKKDGTGIGFDSSTEFELPNGAPASCSLWRSVEEISPSLPL